MEQEATGDDQTVLEAVLSCDIERADLLEEEHELQQQIEKVSFALFAILHIISFFSLFCSVMEAMLRSRRNVWKRCIVD